jgi:type I restriction enzyme M protein
MLDEFDKLQVSIDNGLASPQVPENLRSLLHTYPDIGAILTGSKRLKHLRNEYMSVLFGLGYAIRLDPLDDSEARRLIEEPVASDLSYLEVAANRIVSWCAGQPFLIQSLCNRIFEYCARSDERIVTSDIVQEAAEEMVRDNEHFRTLWDHVGSEKRRFVLLTIRRLSGEIGRITHDLIASKLEQSGIHPDGDEPLGDSLAYLQELELVGYRGERRLGVYFLAIPLIELWLDKHIDFEEYRQRAQRELER